MAIHFAQMVTEWMVDHRQRSKEEKDDRDSYRPQRTGRRQLCPVHTSYTATGMPVVMNANIGHYRDDVVCLPLPTRHQHSQHERSGDLSSLM